MDNLTWVTAGLKKVGTLQSAGVSLKLKNHEALEAVLKGYANRDHVDVLISALNMAEALYYINNKLGSDWDAEIKGAQDAIYHMARRGIRLGSFVFNSAEMAAVKLAMSVHDEQLDNCTVREMEHSIDYVISRIRTKQARAIVTSA